MNYSYNNMRRQYLKHSMLRHFMLRGLNLLIQYLDYPTKSHLQLEIVSKKLKIHI